EVQAALEPLLAGIESLSEQIREYNERIEQLAEKNYPQVALLKQVKGVGTLIALTFLLTLEDPHRFRKSRDVGCYLGLQPGRRNSGQSEPQMHISKQGDPYLRTLLVQGAQHILGPFGVDCDLRRWGLKLAERGGRSGKKRAIIATARKLAVLLHHLCVSGEVYEPLHNSRRTTVAAAAEEQTQTAKSKPFHKEERQKPKPNSGDCVNRLAQLQSSDRSAGRKSGGSTGCNENAQLAPSDPVAPRECGWKDGVSGDSAGEKPLSNEKQTESS